MKVTRSTAVHEAAHAVAAIRAGLVFDTVSAQPDETHELDGALYWDELSESGVVAMPPQLLAVVLLAGPCAEAKAMRKRFDAVFADYAATDDRESVAQLGLTEAQFVEAGRDAVALVERDWPAIERVAGELLAGRRLDFDEVEALVVEGE